MGLDVTYRLCSVPKSDVGTDLCYAAAKVTSKKQTNKKQTRENLLRKFSAEATFQALINAEEDKHVIH